MTINAIGKVSQIGFKGTEASGEAKKQIPEMKPDTFEKQTDENSKAEEKAKSKVPLALGLATLAAATGALIWGINTGKIKWPFGKKGAQEAGDALNKGADQAIKNGQDTAGKGTSDVVQETQEAAGKGAVQNAEMTIAEEAALRTEKELAQKRSAELTQFAMNKKHGIGTHRKSAKKSAEVFEKAAKAAEEQAIIDAKNKAIQEATEALEKAKTKFIKKASKDIPTDFSARVDALIKEGFSEDVAKKIAQTKESYANYLWCNSPLCRELSFVKDFTRLGEAEQKKFEALKKTIEASGIKFADDELLVLFYDGLTDFSNSRYVFDNRSRYLVANGKIKPEEDLLCKIFDKSFDEIKPSKHQERIGGINFQNDFGSDFVAKLKRAKKGDIFTNDIYAQCTGSVLDKMYPGSYEIIIPKGAKVSDLHGRKIFPRNAQFEYLGISADSNGNSMTILRYILPKK